MRLRAYSIKNRMLPWSKKYIERFLKEAGAKLGFIWTEVRSVLGNCYLPDEMIP